MECSHKNEFLLNVGLSHNQNFNLTPQKTAAMALPIAAAYIISVYYSLFLFFFIKI